MNVLDRVHQSYVLGRRVRVLSGHLAALVPEQASLLDVGCGDGRVAREIARRVGAKVRGVDVLVRRETLLPQVDSFDGVSLPYDDRQFDIVLLVDVLHHAEKPLELLRDSLRVARQAVLLKDHLCEGLAAASTLRFMDRVGNRRYGVRLPYGYWTTAQWQAAFRELGVAPDTWQTDLRLYPWPADWVFGRGLHFVARLPLAESGAEAHDKASCRTSAK